MNNAARTALLAAASLVVAVLLLSATFDVPAFGARMSPYADVLDRTAVLERACANASTAVVFDQRGFDTLAEGFILFAAVIGIVALLREEPDERFVAPVDHAPRRTRSRPSDVVRVFGLAFFVVMLSAGVQMIFHGEPTPGGGFQGGVLIAGAFAALYACGSTPRFTRTVKSAHVIEALAALTYPAIGVAGVVVGDAFLANIIPLGTVSHLWSGGTIFFLNVGVGFAVAAAIAGLLVAFLHQLRLRLAHNESNAAKDDDDDNDDTKNDDGNEHAS